MDSLRSLFLPFLASKAASNLPPETLVASNSLSYRCLAAQSPRKQEEACVGSVAKRRNCLKNRFLFNMHGIFRIALRAFTAISVLNEEVDSQITITQDACTPATTAHRHRARRAARNLYHPLVFFCFASSLCRQLQLITSVWRHKRASTFCDSFFSGEKHQEQEGRTVSSIIVRTKRGLMGRRNAMSLPERLVGRDGRVIWDRESNALLPDPGTLVREIRSADGSTGT